MKTLLASAALLLSATAISATISAPAPTTVPAWYRPPEVPAGQVWQGSYGNSQNTANLPMDYGTVLPSVVFRAYLWDDVQNFTTGYSSDITVGGGFAMVQSVTDKYVFFTIVNQSNGLTDRIPVGECTYCFPEMLSGAFYDSANNQAISAVFADGYTFIRGYSLAEASFGKTAWTYRSAENALTNCIQLIESNNEIHFLWYDRTAGAWQWDIVSSTNGTKLFTKQVLTYNSTLDINQCSLAVGPSNSLIGLASGNFLGLQTSSRTVSFVQPLNSSYSATSPSSAPTNGEYFLYARNQVLSFPSSNTFVVSYILETGKNDTDVFPVSMNAYTWNGMTTGAPASKWHIFYDQYKDYVLHSFSADDKYIYATTGLGTATLSIETGAPSTRYYADCIPSSQWKVATTNDYVFSLCGADLTYLSMWEKDSMTYLNASMEILRYQMKYYDDCTTLTDIVLSGGWLYATCDYIMYGVQVFAQKGVTTTAIPGPVTSTPIPPGSTTAAPTAGSTVATKECGTTECTECYVFDKPLGCLASGEDGKNSILRSCSSTENVLTVKEFTGNSGCTGTPTTTKTYNPATCYVSGGGATSFYFDKC